MIDSFLSFQALLFYVPRWLWKNWEAGKIHALMMDLDIGVVQDVEKRQKKRLLLDYLADNLKHHNWWAYRYFFCEFLALVNIVGELPDIKVGIVSHVGCCLSLWTLPHVGAAALLPVRDQVPPPVQSLSLSLPSC